MEGKITITVGKEATHRQIAIKCDGLEIGKLDAFIILRHLLKCMEFNHLDNLILAHALISNHWPQDSCFKEKEITIDTGAINKAKENLK